MSKPRLTDQDYCRAAKRLGCDAAAVAAVAEQESLQAGFDSEGRPTILFERHIFHKLTRGKYDRSHPGISSAVPGGYGLPAAQHGRFSEAFALDPQAAMKAASWGKFQILGKNYAICGFETVDAFVEAMKVSESMQLGAFCAFVLHEGLDSALTDHDWTVFADGYNGSAQRKHHYDSLIAAKFAHWQHHEFGCSDQKESAAALPGAVDTSTEDASGSSQLSDPTSTEQPPALSGQASVVGEQVNDQQAAGGTWDAAKAKYDALGSKLDTVSGTVGEFTERRDAAKSLWATIGGTIKQLVWAVLAFVTGMPPYIYVTVAVMTGVLVILYIRRQTVLGKIRDLAQAGLERCDHV